MRRTLTVAAVALTAPLAAVSAQSSDRIPVDMNKLRCGTDTAEVWVVKDGARRRTGTAIETCRSLDTGSARRVMRISRITDAVFGNHVDTTVDQWNTLEPRSHRSTGTRPGAHLRFQLEWTGDRVRGRVVAQGMAPFTVDQRMPSPVYNSASMDLVMRAAPLARGYSITVPAYSPGRGVTEFTAIVVDEEFVNRQLTWRIDVDFAGLDHAFWVDKTTRQMVKQTLRLDATTEFEFIFVSRGARR